MADPPPPIEIRLQFERDAEPIQGKVAVGGRPASSFIGWLGLTAALDELRRETADDAAGDARG